MKEDSVVSSITLDTAVSQSDGGTRGAKGKETGNTYSEANIALFLW